MSKLKKAKFTKEYIDNPEVAVYKKIIELGDKFDLKKGEKGERGLQGKKGDKGERGLQGEKGERGIQGERGEIGLRGDAGDKGKDGSPDTPNQIADKLNTLNEKVEIKVIKNLEKRLSEKQKETIQKIPKNEEVKRYIQRVAGGGGASYFVQLNDTPSDYTGQKNKLVSVKNDETGLEFSTGETILDPIYLRRDGTLPLTADWDVGGFSIENVYNLADKISCKTNPTVGIGGDFSTFAECVDECLPDLISEDIVITILKGTTLTEEINISNKTALVRNKKIKVQAEKYYPTSVGTPPTADSATATTLRDTSVFTQDDEYNDCWVLIVDGTGTDNGFVQITDTIAASGDIVVASWPGTQPDATSKYVIVGALVDCQGTQDYGINSLANTCITEFYGIGVKDADEFGIQMQRCVQSDAFFCAVYNCDRSGINVAACNNSNIQSCSAVNCNTDNNANNGGMRNSGSVVVNFTSCAVSDNNRYGILATFGGYYIATNSLGDGNGTWGHYATFLGTYSIVGTTASGSSGSVYGAYEFLGELYISDRLGIGTTSPQAQLHTTKGRIVKVDRYTTTTTLDADNHQVFGDTDGGVFTINLPAGVEGTYYRIVNTGSSGNNLTISPNGLELLLGVNASFNLADGESLIIVYHPTEGWF